MRYFGAFGRGLNAAAAGFNWTAFALWGNWWNAAAGGASSVVFLGLVLGPRWWHSLFHMSEPCGLCGHTRKHDLYETRCCRTCHDIGQHCTQRRMNEHRITEARRQGSAGTPAGPFSLAISPSTPYVNPYAGAGQGLSQYLVPTSMQQHLMNMAANLAIATPPVLPEAAWADEAYTGYRAFVLYADPERGVFRLKSITEMGTMWESATLDAKCAHASMGNAPQPEDMSSHMGACSCGIYLCSQQETVVRQAFTESLDVGNSLVLGQCAGWGTVVEHTDGMRVEHARIERLWTLSGKPELCDRLAGIYGVPCTNLWASIK